MLMDFPRPPRTHTKRTTQVSNLTATKISVTDFPVAMNEDRAREELDQEEKDARRASGAAALHETSPATFLLNGLELEESQ